MKKSIILLFTIAAFATASFANDINAQMYEQIQLLKKQVAALEAKMNEESSKSEDKRITKIEKKLAKVSKKANLAKAQSAGDNLKWNVDFGTQVDNIQYDHVSGAKSKNNALMTNRLWLGMKYKGDENSTFYGTLSYLKAFGDSANHSQANINPGYANFDWLTNENANDNTLKVKEAYWLYSNDTFMGSDVSWTASVGRRPSTDGLGINLRADQNRKSALSHTVNVEFDGASAKFNLDQVTGIDGAWLKFCAGRGLTNAKPRFQFDGADYASDDTKNTNIDMFGFIAVPYDNGQYSVHMNYARAWNVIGFEQSAINTYSAVSQGYTPDLAGQAAMAINTPNIAPQDMLGYQMAYAPSFNDVGDLDLATMMFKVDGIGDEISDFLDNTTVFASAAMSKTRPNAKGMLGSTESKTGHSIWIGANAPCPISPDNAKIGIEWNKGSKYWRSMTYGEDTMTGSKIAARGQAFEIYRTQQLTKALSFGLSYVYIDYDYTGSNSFFGAEGTPVSMADAKAAVAAGTGADVVESAQDIKAYMRYRF